MTDTVLFDLDGTLLPMDQTAFTKGYFALLADYAANGGYDPEVLMPSLWKATEAMVRNDGTMTNEARFWKVFHELCGCGNEKDREFLLKFYETEFQKARQFCGFNAAAAELVHRLKRAGYDLFLATNPLFPRPATMMRIVWAGLNPEDFRMITTYETMNTCKPNPDYYSELLDKAGLLAEQCVMIGNDAFEDSAALLRDIPVFLITDCLEHPERLADTMPHGSFKDAEEWILARNKPKAE
jgi:FMN phosphatase YigB (HAD superfamily)